MPTRSALPQRAHKNPKVLPTLPLTLLSRSVRLRWVRRETLGPRGQRGLVAPVGYTWASRALRGIMHVRYRWVSGSDRRVVRTARMTPERTSGLSTCVTSRTEIRLCRWRNTAPRLRSTKKAPDDAAEGLQNCLGLAIILVGTPDKLYPSVVYRGVAPC
jgi:hypothetical protein